MSVPSVVPYARMAFANPKSPTPCTVSFAAAGDGLTIRVSGYLYPDLESARDANTLTGTITLRAGAFSGNFRATFRTWEFAELRDKLRELERTPRSEAVFQTYEQALELVLRGDGAGGFTVAGKATDDVAYGNRLLFEMTIDHDHLRTTIGELDALLREYPARPEQGPVQGPPLIRAH
jgi:hypothetical protein